MNRSFENSAKPMMVKSDNESGYGSKNLLITILTILLVLSFLGINLLHILGNFIQTIIGIFGPLVAQILSVFGYTAGTVIDKSGDIATDVAKTGIDIAGGTVQSVADLLKGVSSGNVNTTAKLQLDNALNLSSSIPVQPEVDVASASIQKPITSSKAAWCLVCEYHGKRGCVEVEDSSKCMSGQVFPNQKLCLNPAQGPIMHSQLP